MTRWDLVYKWADPETQSIVDAVTSALENCDRKLTEAHVHELENCSGCRDIWLAGVRSGQSTATPTGGAVVHLMRLIEIWDQSWRRDWDQKILEMEEAMEEAREYILETDR